MIIIIMSTSYILHSTINSTKARGKFVSAGRETPREREEGKMFYYLIGMQPWLVGREGRGPTFLQMQPGSRLQMFDASIRLHQDRVLLLVATKLQ